jgi:hypothetical protein
VTGRSPAVGRAETVRAIRYRVATPEWIYGTILVCAVLASADSQVSSGELLLRGAVASVAIWFAHVVAVSVASHGAATGIRSSLRHAVRHSTGILIGPMLPILVLAAGAAGAIDDTAAYVAALVTGVLMLGVLGYLALWERRARWYLCATGALVTAAAGFAAITLKALFAG